MTNVTEESPETGVATAPVIRYELACGHIAENLYAWPIGTLMGCPDCAKRGPKRPRAIVRRLRNRKAGLAMTNVTVYRIRIKSNGAAHRKGAWILYRDAFTDFTEACDTAKKLAPQPCGGLVRVTSGTSVKAVAEFDGAAMSGESPVESLDECPIPEGAHWTVQGPDGMWVIRWNEATGTVQARRFDHGSPDGFSAEAADLPAARREVLRIAGLIDDGKAREDR